MRRLWLAIALALTTAGPAAARDGPRHAISMHGDPALPADFAHRPYVEPEAPKGGRLVHGLVGTFDSLNPFIVTGLPAAGIRSHVIESLMTRGFGEPFTLYGLLAQTVETNAERSFVAFRLDPRARFSDGRPVTPADVIFSFRLLRDKGRPNHRTYYRKVRDVEAVDARTVRFDLAGAGDRELPLILGLMPVLPAHAVDPETFERTSLVAPIGSGPYVVAAVRPGASLTLRRDNDYWGKDLPTSRGLYNFDEIRFDYYRDANSHFEAFRRGLYDIRTETDPGRWFSGYDFPAVRDGEIVREAVADGLPKPMSSFAFNLRRPPFADRRVRRALAGLFDFGWINRTYYHGAYRRSVSFFEGSDLSARGRPASARERELLTPFPGIVLPEAMDGTYGPPATDGSGRDREALRRAVALLGDAGFRLVDGTMRSVSTGAALAFEILVATADQERLALAYRRMLARAGVEARVRVVDAVQFDRRRQTYDYDMVPATWAQSLSPGNEQAFYFGSAAAEAPGSRNYMGLKEPAVDALIVALLAARTREEFVAAVRALDRVLMSGEFVVPLFHLPQQWIARRKHIARPPAASLYGVLPESFWRAPP